MKKLRVAINGVTELASRYGSRIYLMGLVQELARCESIELVLLVGKGMTGLLPEDLQPRAREIEGSASRSFLQIFCQAQIRAALVAERIDVYHVPNTLPLWRVIPTVVTIHDLTELRVPKYSRVRTAYRSVVNYTAARWADRVVTVSENSKRDLCKSLGIPVEKIAVTYAGVSNAFRPRERAECRRHVRERYGIDTDFLLASGGLSRNKNVENLLSAVGMLRESGVRLPLVLTGFADRKENQTIHELIVRFGLSESVIVTGYVGDDGLPFLYGACAVVVYPSLYEGFGFPAVEAMASGAPLVASNTSSLPEVVGDAGILVDPRDPRAIADAVRQTLLNEDERHRRVCLGVKRAERFRWREVAAKTLQVYRAVARDASGADVLGHGTELQSLYR
jgi:glycosyltransferase involved in cell wall biosynthesis